MSTRIVRINELVQRELSSFLRKRYATEAASITISGVEIAPDLKTGKVFVSVFGTPEEAQARFVWLTRRAVELKGEIARHIKMKWTPELSYFLDATPERAARVLGIIEELDRAEKERSTPPPQDPS